MLVVLWLGGPARAADAVVGAGRGALRIAGLESRPRSGPEAGPVNDALLAPDFTLQLRPRSLQLRPRSTGTLGVHVGSVLGFRQPVRLAVTVLPVNRRGHPSRWPVARPTPTTVTPFGRSTLVVRTRRSASRLYVITLTATAGGSTHVATAYLRVA